MLSVAISLTAFELNNLPGLHIYKNLQGRHKVGTCETFSVLWWKLSNLRMIKE